MSLRPLPTFAYHGRELPMFDHRYNTTALNERALEIPIARDFIGRRRAGIPLVDGLEVGNVLGHYAPVLHRVVDKFEAGPDVDNVDVMDVAGRYPWIVTISTLEHVRWDAEPDNQDPAAALRALEHLRRLLTDDGSLLVTVPVGYHPEFDDDLADRWNEPEHVACFERVGDGWEDAGRFTYHPYGPWANALYVGEWGPLRG